VVRPPGRDLRLHQFESTSAVNFACNPRMAGCAPTRRRVIAATHRHGVRAGVGTCPRPRNSLTVTDFGGSGHRYPPSDAEITGYATNNRDNGVVEAFGGAPPALDFPAPSPAARARVPTTTPTHGSATGKLRGNRAGVGHASGGRACCWCGDRRGGGTRSTIGRAYRTGPGRAPGRSP